MKKILVLSVLILMSVTFCKKDEPIDPTAVVATEWWKAKYPEGRVEVTLTYTIERADYKRGYLTIANDGGTIPIEERFADDRWIQIVNGKPVEPGKGWTQECWCATCGCHFGINPWQEYLCCISCPMCPDFCKSAYCYWCGAGSGMGYCLLIETW